MTKENFRKISKKRLNFNALHGFKKDFLIFKEVFKIIKLKKAKKILLYIPLAYEPNLTRFRRILSKNCTIFVPFMQDESLKMVKLRLPFEKKAFGVREPRNSYLKADIDLAVVPVVGVDKELRRIGHGKGFYDRFFAGVKKKISIIFTQSIHAFCDEKLSQNHDIKADFYITPHKKYYKKEQKNVYRTSRSYRRYHRCWDRIFSCQKNQ